MCDMCAPTWVWKPEDYLSCQEPSTLCFEEGSPTGPSLTDCWLDWLASEA